MLQSLFRTGRNHSKRRKHVKLPSTLIFQEMEYRDIEIHPFVVGALSEWVVRNDVLMRRLCAPSYVALFRKFCVSDSIRWSRDIYIEHMTGHHQYGNEASSAELVEVLEEQQYGLL
ncbi:hypothetical protein TNCV_1060921 [Trichonephila clavipes]|nr:hypothetical protein TNCV_1060921 [Trichonephila clavipes]